MNSGAVSFSFTSIRLSTMKIYNTVGICMRNKKMRNRARDTIASLYRATVRPEFATMNSGMRESARYLGTACAARMSGDLIASNNNGN